MADPITHALIGASCVPSNPLLGAAAGLLPDIAVLPMNAYTLSTYNKLAIKEDWALAPEWTKTLYRIMHSGVMAIALFIGTAIWAPDYLSYTIAYLIHSILDIITHQTTSFCWPGLTLAIGKDWWTTWWIPTLTISISLYIAYLTLF